MKADVDPTADSKTSAQSHHNARTESLRRAIAHFAEVREYAIHYIAAKVGIVKLTVRRLVILAGIAAIGFLVVGAMLVSATVLLLLGASNAIGSAFNPPRPWIGQMTIGLVFISGILIAAWLVLRKATATSRRRTIEEFEGRRRKQKLGVGHDVVDRANMGEVEA